LSHTLYRLLRLLDEQRLWYRIERHREDSVMIAVTAVGERLEIDVFEDGHVEFSRFRGDEGVESDAGPLDQIIRQHGKDSDIEGAPVRAAFPCAMDAPRRA
jgi:hypothetical protein